VFARRRGKTVGRLYRDWILGASLAVSALVACDGSTADDAAPDAGGTTADAGGAAADAGPAGGADGGAGGADGGAGSAGGAGGGGGMPAPPLTDCGPDVDLVDFNAAARAEGERLVLDGATGDADVFSASCSPGIPGGDAVVRFTAPAAGHWRFSTTAPDLDTVLFALADCADGFSEMACNDDAATGTRSSRLVLDLEAGAIAYLVVDRYDGLDAAPFTLTAEPVTVTPPTLTAVEAFYTVGSFAREPTGAVGVVATGTDPEGDVTRYRFSVFDPEGEPIRLTLDGAALEYALDADRRNVVERRPDGTFTVALTNEFRGLPTVGGVSFAVGDATGRWSEPVQVAPVTTPPVRARGERCDGAGARDACPEGDACVDRDDDGVSVCEVATPPAVTGASAWYNAEANALSLRLAGTDAESDVIGVLVDAFNDAGTRVRFGLSSAPVPAVFQRLRQSDGTFDGVVGVRMGFALCGNDAGRAYDDCIEDGGTDVACTEVAEAAFDACNRERAAAIARVRVIPIDLANLEGEARDFDVAPTPTTGRGEVCDFLSGVGRCADGLGCADGGERDVLSTCQPLTAACPAGWDVVDLNAHVRGDAFTYGGDTAGASRRGGDATCLVPGLNVAHRFVAPARGRYRATLVAKDADLGLFARTHCGFAGPAFELACNAEPEPPDPRFTAVAEFDLEAGAEAFLFVRRPDLALAGPYTLTVAPVGR
jgi:hypothetical protein